MSFWILLGLTCALPNLFCPTGKCLGKEKPSILSISPPTHFSTSPNPSNQNDINTVTFNFASLGQRCSPAKHYTLLPCDIESGSICTFIGMKDWSPAMRDPMSEAYVCQGLINARCDPELGAQCVSSTFCDKVSRKCVLRPLKELATTLWKNVMGNVRI
jgi:hypothetical protein